MSELDSGGYSSEREKEENGRLYTAGIYIYTHTHTHTYIYIYIYIYVVAHVCEKIRPSYRT